ncbi:IscS subfamily cysteine desulfurase [Verminephrobacter aporrectodeae subsp. tuberculatae]|uniref:Cysteine desulfurase IscS n=1 Tax=Verminephrobacter aporrectodeae subsp. tuberculatae TaxID=1110392 RepID=A0ABT3KPI7_9BURK|nr:IscS subfamily cysteine desulfurase [Verminephrobacter aporrectodeae]MCW5220823.1 IscS subfamily cysteine desulfurase [Verminephrobacter aporrectodeae subsp. tuberculatae]MCW5255216.1 IscS subfamily cysteine desulfurase [Verminephrobacter aporrectodeae subsp. tuberculatae]MCW5290118.1 IscS subfamily cysteine desulfurase [Verminephrobacter aporrectodeae subsp. tuberculatae]MCW5320232.1 IscS subfamily cysteine desulfurase [Verminephrobacter aporrectodeae subsp. tuberculatae]MCW8164085.1 IscS 
MNMTPHFPIYLDYGATTPVDPRVVDAMVPWLREHFGNPASRSHAWGWEAEEAVEKARAQVADLIGADPREIVWTSGATESTNLALKGAAQFYKSKGRHLITLKTEHKAVLDTMRELERQGFEASYLNVQEDGLLDLDVLRAAIRPDTVLVSILFVNNEIGVIQDIAAIGALCREKGVLLHVDAAQATGRVEIDMSRLPIDLMSMTAHKTYGPKGIGALYVRRKPRVRLEAQMHGGGHERGLRSGTLPTHQIVGMGEAFRIAKAEMAESNAKARVLQQRLLDGLKDIEQVYINGSLEHRVPQNLNMSFNFVEGESLIMGIKGLAVSSGSACTSASLEPSYVLRALGRSDELAHSSLRMTIGRFTTQEEIDCAILAIRENVARLRELSPLWEMHQEGIDISSIQWAAH